MSSIISIDKIVLEAAYSMRDVDAIKAILKNPSNINTKRFYPSPSWLDLNLSNGYPALLLFFSELQQRNLLNSDGFTHQLVINIKEGLEERGITDLSTFSGLCGICFALQRASLGEKRYGRILNTLNSRLMSQVTDLMLKPIHHYVNQQIPVPVNLYDTISGIVGIGRYAMEYLSGEEFVKNILRALIAICRPLSIKGKIVPGWFANTRLEQYPLNGFFNLGLSHGISGVLACLSIALLKGFEVEGQKEAITQIVEWIQKKSFTLNSTTRWETLIPWEKEIGEESGSPIPSRDAWCYGVPGIARALYLAGKALKDEKMKSFSLEAFKGIFLRSRAEWEIPAPTLCHGIAGLLAITSEMSKEEGCESLLAEVKMLEDQLMNSYQPHAPFGFKDIEFCPDHSYIELDKICYLEGTIGILLTLLTLSESQSEWKLPLLIS